MKHDYQDRPELMEKLQREDYMSNSTRYTIEVVIVLFCISLGYFVGVSNQQLTRHTGGLDCSRCHSVEHYKKQQMTQYFIKVGSKTPEAMATAVLKTKSPRLLAAMASIESNGNPSLRHTGYKKRHHGAFQVNPKDWGRVPKDAVGQALQAERILAELTDHKPIRQALNQYGGDSTNNYSNTILAELTRVP